MRSLILGVSAGALLESAHVALKFFGLVGEVGYDKLGEILPHTVDRFAPLFFADHVAAIGSWILFYTIEAVAIMSVLNRFPNDGEAASRAISKLTTLPQKMMPLRLHLFKSLVARGGAVTAGAGAGTGAAQAKGARVAQADIATTSAAFVDTPAAPQVAPDFPKLGGVDPTWAQGSAGVKERLRDRLAKEAPQKDKAGLRGEEVREGAQGFVGEPLKAPERKKKGLRPGQWDPDSSLAAHRMKELAGRRAYLKNFWYAAAISENVKQEPLGVELLGEKVVLFRGKDGTVHCIGDVCPHRGAPLSLGWVNEHDCVVCPYHGWAFDSAGVLRDVPAAEHEGEWPKKQLVEAFPVVEKGGFVWLFYGSKELPEDERPPIPFVPELEDPTWKAVYGEIEFECGHWSVFENAIDMAHIHYLHNDTFGNQDKPEIRSMTCAADAYGVLASFKLHNKPVNALWNWSQVPAVEVTAKALLPSTSVITFTLGAGLSFTTFVNTVPINGGRTVNRFCLVRNISWDKLGVFNWGAWDGLARQAMMRILTEDKGMVERLHPELLSHEISVKADMPQTAFRKLRQEYIDMGYGVAPEQPRGSPAANDRGERSRDM